MTTLRPLCCRLRAKSSGPSTSLKRCVDLAVAHPCCGSAELLSASEPTRRAAAVVPATFYPGLRRSWRPRTAPIWTGPAWASPLQSSRSSQATCYTFPAAWYAPRLRVGCANPLSGGAASHSWCFTRRLPWPSSLPLPKDSRGKVCGRLVNAFNTRDHQHLPALFHGRPAQDGRARRH